MYSIASKNGHCPHCKQSFNNVILRDCDNCRTCFQCGWIDYFDILFKPGETASSPGWYRLIGTINAGRIVDLNYNAIFSRPGGGKKSTPVERIGRHNKLKPGAPIRH